MTLPLFLCRRSDVKLLDLKDGPKASAYVSEVRARQLVIPFMGPTKSTNFLAELDRIHREFKVGLRVRACVCMFVPCLLRIRFLKTCMHVCPKHSHVMHVANYCMHTSNKQTCIHRCRILKHTTLPRRACLKVAQYIHHCT
jgi:hypothetical protein